MLVEAKADKDKALDDGRTPLFVATREFHLEVVCLLVEAKADKDNSAVHYFARRPLGSRPPVPAGYC